MTSFALPASTGTQNDLVYAPRVVTNQILPSRCWHPCRAKLCWS